MSGISSALNKSSVLAFILFFVFFPSLEYYEKKNNVQARVGKKKNVGAEQENKGTAAEMHANSWSAALLWKWRSSSGAKQIGTRPLDLNSAQNQIQHRAAGRAGLSC